MDAAYCVENGQLYKVGCAVKDCNTYFISDGNQTNKYKSDISLQDHINDDTKFLIPTVANHVFACFNVKYCGHAICHSCFKNLRKKKANSTSNQRRRAKRKIG